jgi:probable DNA repair protein
LAGFHEVPTALRLLLEALRTSSVAIQEILPAAPPSALVSLACDDLSSEFDAAARWVRARLEANQDASLAIFVANLSEHRLTVERILRSVLQPADILQPLSSSAPAPVPFCIHSGMPARQQPVIAAALAVLDFSRRLIPISSISAFLSSPYVPAAVEERTARALADAKLRSYRELEFALFSIERATANCPGLVKNWPSVRSVLRHAPADAAEPAAWTRFWRQLLKAVHWPGESLTDAEAEAVEQWLNLLSGFDSLGLTGCRFTAAEALDELHSLVSQSTLPAGNLSAPIHVLDPVDAMPLRFDGVWLTGASELEWPPAVNLPAFLPLSLLRNLGVATASPQGRRARARELSRYIQSAASSVVASYSATEAASAKLSAHFCFAREVCRADLHLWEDDVLLDQVKQENLEEIEDTNAPPLPDGITISGGSHVLKSQSACPFQAFARWRLHAESVEEGEFSYDFRQRGQFLHAALNEIWKELRDSTTLRSLDETRLRDVVCRGVKQALSIDRVSSDFRVQLRDSEQQRLVELILEWLELEKRRPGNFRVNEAEKNRDFTLSRLTLHVRADRIDELDNGGLVVIDYKSGKIKREDLDDDRPREPQLLAYATMLASQADKENCVEGVYFASLHRDSCRAEGYGRVPHFPGGTGSENWNSLLDRWQTTIRKLVHEFENGHASRAMSSEPCQYCGVKPLCRIEETRRGRDTEDAG